MDYKTNDIVTENCQLLKNRGHVLIRTPSNGSILVQEVAVKLKGTKGQMEMTPVCELYRESDCFGAKFGSPKPFASYLFSKQLQ